VNQNSYPKLIKNIDFLLEKGRELSYITVNQVLIQTYWNIGRLIVEHEQKGESKAMYGEKLIEQLSKDLKEKYGRGFGKRNVHLMRLLYVKYPQISQISSREFQVRDTKASREFQAKKAGVSAKFQVKPSQASAKFQVKPSNTNCPKIGQEVSGQFQIRETEASGQFQECELSPSCKFQKQRTTPSCKFQAKPPNQHSSKIGQEVSAEFQVKPSQASTKFQIRPSKLTWSHYCELLSVSDDLARSFYEKQCIKENWSVRELKRQINSMLFERLALTKNKTEILKLAKHGQTIESDRDIVKDPYFLEFLGIPENHIYSEKELEQKIIDNLQMFLLELGKGFAFVQRQFRITLNNTHFYIDLVFYHRILKCFVLIDLKIGKVDHSDIGQMNMYLNYFKNEENTESDNAPIGIILAADKDEIMVEYALGGISNKLFVSKYKIYLPNKLQLKQLICNSALDPLGSGSQDSQEVGKNS